MGLYRDVSRATGQVMRAAVLLLLLQEVQTRAHLGSAGNKPMKGNGQPTYGISSSPRLILIFLNILLLTPPHLPHPSDPDPSSSSSPI
ncbi:hypothetical protein NHX12_025563 [Muraenolepis orangiensis]|uniref:Secreted protein n=1 Tax=Muraenolepis orangiensis TaxID=630683 RepID=A0A9Q0ITG5_9TELE|nr:hypothetical protein NHX12_025563 [Muraenolepis orangiensis]